MDRRYTMNNQLERMFKRLKDMLRNSPYREQADPDGPRPSKPAAAGRPRRKRRKSGREAA